MRPNVRAFVEAAVAAYRPAGPVYEFGAYQVAGQEGIGDLRSLFSTSQYVGCDLRPGPGVDRIEDLSRLSLPDAVAGAVLCLDTLEHVFDVPRAAAEMIRVLRPGGLMIVSAPMDFHIHAHPDDYWRMTPSCLARLLCPLSTVVGSQGRASYPHTVFGLAMKEPVSPDFVPSAEALICDLEARLARQAAEVPRSKRLKAFIRGLARSKGDRRRESEFFVTQWAIAAPMRSPARSPESALVPPAAAAIA
jgi:SAM-dependent methyltransferase